MDSLWVTHSKIYFDEFCLLHVGPAAIILQDEEGRDQRYRYSSRSQWKIIIKYKNKSVSIQVFNIPNNTFTDSKTLNNILNKIFLM